MCCYNLWRSAAHRQPKNLGSSTRKLQSIHLEQYKKFIKEKFEVCIKPFTETLSKNKLPTLKRPPGKTEGSACYTKEWLVCSSECTFPLIHEIKIWTNSFHKNHTTQPSPSNGGKVTLGMKAEILLFLEPNLLKIEVHQHLIQVHFYFRC